MTKINQTDLNIFYLIIYILCVLFLCYCTFSLATDYQNNESRSHVSFIIWTIDTIDLFIHETGHLVFGVFGRFVGFLGGSLFQIIIPLSTVIVFGRSSVKSLPFTLYWTGQSTVNVSIYIGDAPYLRLHLISRSAIHDWRWLLNNLGLINQAENIAFTVSIIGLLTCLAGIGLGFYFIYQSLLKFISPDHISSQ